MKLGFRAGVKYGLEAKIRIPEQTATDSLNRFSIEFGYDELIRERRFLAGISPAPLVRKLLNPGVDYETSLKSARNLIYFSIQTVTGIPRGGGILIVGPSNFLFETSCLPVAVDPPPGVVDPPNTDLPFDTTCTSE